MPTIPEDKFQKTVLEALDVIIKTVASGIITEPLGFYREKINQLLEEFKIQEDRQKAAEGEGLTVDHNWIDPMAEEKPDGD